MHKKLFLPLILVFAILSQACGSQNFATDLRLVLAASGPLIESLNLGAKRGAVIADFTDLANGAATLADDLKVCQNAKPCELTAVEKFDGTFEVVINRGHFGLSPKLQVVEGVVRGIISSAKIYFGGATNARMASKPVTEKSIKAQVEALKVAMQPQ